MFDLKMIKRDYGEEMMHFCRDNFPTILEKEGELYKLMHSSFYKNKTLYFDLFYDDLLDEFKDFLISRYSKEEEHLMTTNKTPFELMEEAGYELYECKTEEDIQRFKKYYIKDEELCTFDGGRLERCYVFFAIKKNVDEIKRENFNEPRREDEYGTSVMSIQFSRGENNMISIKNRYNHTVLNPDATYGNNLDRIIPGLFNSFKDYYNFNLKIPSIDDFELYNYVEAEDGIFYRYNVEINNTYYCSGNIIIDNYFVNKEYGSDSSRYIVFDFYILDLKEKRLFTYGNVNEPFVHIYKNIKKIDIKKCKKYKRIRIETDEGVSFITLDNNNKMISYKNNYIKEIENSFMSRNTGLKRITMNNVIKIKDCFLYNQNDIKEINLNSVEYIGREFLRGAKLNTISLPKLKEVDDDFLISYERLLKVEFPLLEKISNNFMVNAISLERISLPNVKKIGDNFLSHAVSLKKMEAPMLEEVGNNFVSNNGILEYFELSSLKNCGNNFLSRNICLKELYLPKLESVGNSFVLTNEIIESIYMPNLKFINNMFLNYNKKLKEVSLPQLEIVLDDFISHNSIIEKLEMPKLIKVGSGFLSDNKNIKILDLLNIFEIGNSFLMRNNNINSIKMPKLFDVGYNFLRDNNALEVLELPNLYNINHSFLASNNTLRIIKIPKAKYIGSNFLLDNNKLLYFKAPKLKCVGENFLTYNKVLKKFICPKLERIEENFLDSVENFEEFKISEKVYYNDELLDNCSPLIKQKLLKK